MVSNTLRPLCPREKSGTDFKGSWLGPRTGLDDKENVAPTGILPQDRPALSESTLS